MQPHGTRTRYVHQKCRCDECRAANAEAQRQLRDQRARRLYAAPHGTLNAYTNWSCRCPACIEAGARRTAS